MLKGPIIVALKISDKLKKTGDCSGGCFNRETIQVTLTEYYGRLS